MQLSERFVVSETIACKRCKSCLISNASRFQSITGILWHFVLSTWTVLCETKAEANETLPSTEPECFDREMFQLLLKYFIYSRNAVYVMSTLVIIFFLFWMSFGVSCLLSALAILLMRALLFMAQFFSTVSEEKKSIKHSLAEQQVYEMFPWISFSLITAALFMDIMAAAAASETALTAPKTWV